MDTADKAPVARASITVRTKADSVLVTGAYSNTDGSFRVQGLRPGAYYLRAVSVGFKPRNYTFEITDAAPRVNVGPVPLTRIAITLQSVQVEGERPLVVIEPDRNTYRAKDIAPAAANASACSRRLRRLKSMGMESQPPRKRERSRSDHAAHSDRGTQLAAISADPANIASESRSCRSSAK